MGADKNRTRGILSTSFGWPERIRYSNIPNKPERKSSRWKDVLASRKLLGKTEEGNEWIKGVVVCSCITGLILFINIILTITATIIAYRRQTNRGQFQMAELYSGQCSRSSHWATGLHLVINALSTILLGASNYVMQCLGAPSRADIDEAHAKSRWLDIGTFSLRNFRVMGIRRKVLWVLLLITSTPIHLIYNSVIFSSLSNFKHSIFMIPDDLSSTESLISDDSLGRENFLDIVGNDATVVQAQIFNGTFTNTTLEDCRAKYNVVPNTKYGTLIFTADRQHFHNTGSFEIWRYDWYTWTWPASLVNWTLNTVHWSNRLWDYSLPDPIYVRRYSDIYREYHSFNFRDHTFLLVNDSKNAKNPHFHDMITLRDYNQEYNPRHDELREYLDTPTHWKNSTWAANITFELIGNYKPKIDASPPARTVPVSHCLFKEAGGQDCVLFFSPMIAIVVITCNVIKLFCMVLTAQVQRRDLLLTVGDALASFLSRPDSTTRGRCLLSHAEMNREPKAWSLPAMTFGRSKGYTLQQRAPSPTSHSLENLSDMPTPAIPEISPSLLPRRKRWYQAASWKRWMVVLLFFISCIATGIYLIVRAIPPGTSFESAMNAGFGKFTTSYFIRSDSTRMISAVLLGNTPQIVLSILYFLTNGILTCMLVAAEWDRYAQRRRPLRVSWPRGEQRSTYYLSLPYRYSIPLLVLFGMLHWLLSQSIFYVGIKFHGVFGVDGRPSESRGCGYSPMAMFIAFWVAILTPCLLLGLGARQFKSHMPLATHCSAAISAACHPPDGDEGAALKPVMWGEIPRREETEVTTEAENGFTGAGTQSSMEYAHCSFTSLDVVTPNMVRLYC